MMHHIDAGQQGAHPGGPQPCRHWLAFQCADHHRQFVHQRRRHLAERDMPGMGRHEIAEEEAACGQGATPTNVPGLIRDLDGPRDFNDQSTAA